MPYSFHSMWALFRMVQFQNKVGKVNNRYKQLLVENINAFEEDELTIIGKSLVQLVQKRVSL